MPRQAGPPKPRKPAPRPRRGRARTSRWRSWALAASALLLIPLLVFLGRHLALRQRWLYPSLGVEIPAGYGAVGMDLSRWNGRVHWGDVPGSSVRLDFVWLKATEGGDWSDNQYARNREGAAEQGIRSGAYHFFRPASDPLQQARFFWTQAGLQPGDLPPVLDLETSDGLPDEELLRRTRLWMDETTRLCRCRPVIYTNRDFYRRIVREHFPETSIWLAAYELRNLPMMREDPRILFWQFSDAGRVNGIREAVDLNVFAGDTLALERWVQGSWGMEQLP